LTQYRRGYEAERKCVKELEDMGYVAIRSGGSKKIDVVAFKRTDLWECQDIKCRDDEALIRAIMVTRNKTTAKKRQDKEYLLSLPLPTTVSKELWLYNRGKFEVEFVNE